MKVDDLYIELKKHYDPIITITDDKRHILIKLIDCSVISLYAEESHFVIFKLDKTGINVFKFVNHSEIIEFVDKILGEIYGERNHE